MTDIQFDEEVERARPSFVEKRPFMINLVMRTGIVDNDSAANVVLLVLAIFMFFLSAVAYFVFNPNPAPEPLSEEDVSSMNIQ